MCPRSFLTKSSPSGCGAIASYAQDEPFYWPPTLPGLKRDGSGSIITVLQCVHDLTNQRTPVTSRAEGDRDSCQMFSFLEPAAAAPGLGDWKALATSISSSRPPPFSQSKGSTFTRFKLYTSHLFLESKQCFLMSFERAQDPVKRHIHSWQSPLLSASRISRSRVERATQ